jgi:hypothetical protein
VAYTAADGEEAGVFTAKSPAYAELVEEDAWYQVAFFAEEVVTAFVAFDDVQPMTEAEIEALEESLEADRLWKGQPVPEAAFAPAAEEAEEEVILVEEEHEETVSEEPAQEAGASAIVTQPQDQAVALNDTVTFTIGVASGATIQWQYDNATGDWTNIPENKNWHGTKTETLTFAAITSRSRYSYRALVTLDGVTESSLEVGFVIGVAPEFTVQPENQYAALNETVTFTAEASGNPAYQWQYDGGTGTWVNIPENKNWHGTQTNTLTFSATTTRSRQSYRVIATTGAGEAISDVVTLTIGAAPEPATLPEFTTQPANQYAALNETVTFTAEASGDPTYQWQYDGGTGTWVNIPENKNWHGTKTTTLTFSATTSRSRQSYRVIATNDAGETISDVVTLTIGTAPEPATLPEFTTQPVDQYVPLNETVTMTAEASGDPAYQWQYDGGTGTWVNIPENKNWHGTQTTTLTFTAINSRARYMYRVIATNDAGETISNEISLTIGTAPEPATLPEFTTQPTNQMANLGDDVAFTAEASGDPTYQWQYDGGTGEWVNIPENKNWHGTQTNTLTFSATTSRSKQSYRVVATNAAGETISDVVTLSLAAKPEFTTQPTDQMVPAGETVTFTAEANGDATYQWQYDGGTGTWTNIPENKNWHGTKTTTLTFSATTSRAKQSYRVIATNIAGETISDEVHLSLATKPVFTTQPAGYAVALAATVTFTAEADGNPTYQWQYDGGTGEWVNIPENKNWHGTTTNTLTFTATASRARQSYRVIASNTVGETISDVIQFTLVTNIVIDGVTYQPLTETTCAVISYSGTETSLTIPETVEGYTVTEIGAAAFKDNTELTSIDLPDTIEIIRTQAFMGCTSLATMN